jgi:hypothetical protein
MPLYGFLVFTVRGNDAPFTDTSYIAAGILLSTTLLYVNSEACDVGIRAMISCLRLLSAVVISLYFIMAVDPDSPWLGFFTEANVALFGIREYGGITFPYIYFLASPLLIYLLAYETHKVANAFNVKRFISCSVAVLALGLSGTRAHLLIAMLYVPVYLIVAKRAQHRVMLPVVSMILAVVVALVGSSLIEDFFDPRETSNSMKLEALYRYGEIFEDPVVLLLGQGFNAHEWSLPLRQMIATEESATKTELTYLELIRVFGVVNALPYFMLLMAIVYRSSQLVPQYGWLYPAFAVSLINSSLNPYLFSTNGMLPMALLLALIGHSHRGSITPNQSVARTRTFAS